MNKFSSLLKKNSNFLFSEELLEAFELLNYLVPEQLTQNYTINGSVSKPPDISTMEGMQARMKIEQYERADASIIKKSPPQITLNFELDVLNEIKKNLHSIYRQAENSEALKKTFHEQNLLVNLLEKIQPAFKDKELSFNFEKLMQGQDVQATSTEAMFILLFHKSLSDENFKKIFNIFQKKENFDLFKTLQNNQYLFSFYIKNERGPQLKSLLENQNNDTLLDCVKLICDKKIPLGFFGEILLTEVAHRNLEIPQVSRNKLFNIFLNSNKYYHNLVKNPQKIDDKKTIFETLKKLFKDSPIPTFMHLGLLSIAVKMSDQKIKDVNQYIYLLETKDDSKKFLFNDFDLSSSDLLSVYKKISNREDTLIKSFIFSNIDKMSKNDIAEMMVFDKSKFNLIKDAILKVKLNEELNVNQVEQKRVFVKI